MVNSRSARFVFSGDNLSNLDGLCSVNHPLGERRRCGSNLLIRAESLTLPGRHYCAAANPAVPSHLPDDLQSVRFARWFAEEVQPHEPMLRGWIRSRFPFISDVDDLIQESYARLIRAHAHGGVQNPRNYLFTTARNVALDLFRHEKVLRVESIEENASMSVLEETANVAETVSRNQELQLLREAMEALPDRCQQVFTLRKLYGLSHREIATQLGISERTVEAQIDKAMRRCEEFLRSRGVS